MYLDKSKTSNSERREYLLFCSLFSVSSRLVEVKRVTKETNVHVKINLDGTGVANYSTWISCLDYILDVSMVYSSCQ